VACTYCVAAAVCVELIQPSRQLGRGPERLGPPSNMPSVTQLATGGARIPVEWIPGLNSVTELTCSVPPQLHRSFRGLARSCIRWVQSVLETKGAVQT
jgi:hypothetical protein